MRRSCCWFQDGDFDLEGKGKARFMPGCGEIKGTGAPVWAEKYTNIPRGR
jgi:hypothetical protein